MAGLRVAVFLDRDGTVIEDGHYLSDPDGVRLLPGAAAAIARLNRAGLPAIIVTNQSGIGRGYFTEEEHLAVHARVVALLAAGGARIDGAYHCPHAPDHDPPCDCRKPRPGLFLRAAAEHAIDLSRSFYLGDRARDVLPGTRLGGTGFIIRAGQGEDSEEIPPGSGLAESLEEAVDAVLGEVGRS